MRRDTMSDILKSVHKTANGLYEAGAISETTMHKFDEVCIADEIPKWGLDVNWIAGGSATPPLGLTFSRCIKGGEDKENIVCFNMSRDQAKKLADFIIKSLSDERTSNEILPRRPFMDI